MTAPKTAVRDGQLSRIRHLAERVHAIAHALETSASSGTVIGLDAAQALALAAVECANYCSIHDGDLRR